MAMPVTAVGPAPMDPRLIALAESSGRGVPPAPHVLRYEQVQEANEELAGRTPQTSPSMPILEDETRGRIIDLYA